MFPGGPTSSAPGATRDMILEFSGAFVGGQAVCKLTPYDRYRERWWTFFIGGKWVGKNYYMPASGDLEIALPFDSSSPVVSIWPIEVGNWDNFGPDDIPNAEALFEEANDADMFLIRIKQSYQLTAVKGDTQLTSIAITGARRGRNVEEVPYFKQRGRLRYSILYTGAAYIVRWYAGDRMVAEGSIAAPGALSCTEKNGSGLTITCTLAYTGDVKLRTGNDGAFLDLKWNKRFPIHYSTSTLTYPRTPEAYVYDDGASDEYFYRIPSSLPAGSYNYNALQEDDEGDVQTSISAPSDSPKVITPGPIGPTIVSVTAAGLVTWTNGEAGCTYKVYFSAINEPINFGNRATPAPVGPTALNATSASVGALTGAAATDFTSNYATLVTAFDAAIATATLNLTYGEATWLGFLSTLRTSLLAAVDVWAIAIGKTLNDAKNQIDQQIAIVEGAENSVALEGLGSTEWTDFTGTYYGGLLLFLGAILEGQSGRYVFSNGIAPGSAPVGTGSATGTAPDGTSGTTGMSFQQSLKSAGEPFVRVGVRRFVVRATKASVEERNDQVFQLEINGSNVAELPRPNDAQIKAMSFSGGVLSVVVTVPTANQKVAATAVDLYVVTAGGAIVLGSAVDSEALSDDLGGYKQTSLLAYTMPGTGWFDIAVAARSAAGQRSASYPRKTVEYGGGTVPGAVSTITAQVQRNRGIRPEEA